MQVQLSMSYEAQAQLTSREDVLNETTPSFMHQQLLIKLICNGKRITWNELDSLSGVKQPNLYSLMVAPG
jgi:hypothetical protein